MDMTKLEIMRIPVATILFLASVFLLSQYFVNVDSMPHMDFGAFICIGMLVSSMVLFSHLDMPINKH